MPMSLNTYTDSMFPMKYFEYVAALVPVVCTPLEFLKHIDHHVLTANSATGLTNELKKAISIGRPI